MPRRGTGLAALAVATLIGAHAGLARASTAETQARLAKARPVATQTVTPPPPPVAPDRQTAGREPLTKPPRSDLPSHEAPRPKPAPRHDFGLILLLPALLALVAVVRWFARRRRSGSQRV